MYLQASQESVAETIKRLPEDGFIMLNLFRLRDLPDYSRHPELEPDTPVSCLELFFRYMANMDQYLAKIGAKRIFLAKGAPCLVGPPGERWDVVQMVQYSSRGAFIDLSSDPDVVAEVPLREVMIEDSRVMPMVEQPLDVGVR